MNKFKYFFKSIISTIKFSKYHKHNDKNLNLISADLIRNIHSIEKGLSIKNVRLGFGHQKQKEMIKQIEILKKNNSNYYKEIIIMAISVLKSYILFHNEKNFSDDYIIELRQYVDDNKKFIEKDFGGVCYFNKKDLLFNIKEIEHFFKTRHSVRNYSNKSVKMTIIKKAIDLARTCPSACNRQAVRCYVIDKNKAGTIIRDLSGIGGFAKDIDKFIIITGKISSYTYNEHNQFIVSASIFCGYLSLTLHLYGLGSCIIQRPVIWNKKCQLIKKEYKIEDDEQIVCLLGVGNIEENTIVPISHRINTDNILKVIE